LLFGYAFCLKSNARDVRFDLNMKNNKLLQESVIFGKG